MVTFREKLNTPSIPPKHLTLFKFIFGSGEEDIKESISPWEGASLVAQTVKNLQFDPWIGKTPLEKGIATHSSILTWKIP